MEDDKEIVDSGIVGTSEVDELYEQVEELEKQIAEKDERIKQLESDNEELRSDLDDSYREVSNLEDRLEDFEDEDNVSMSGLLDNLELHLKRDGMWTPELEEWFEQYYRFYLDEVE